MFKEHLHYFGVIEEPCVIIDDIVASGELFRQAVFLKICADAFAEECGTVDGIELVLEIDHRLSARDLFAHLIKAVGAGLDEGVHICWQILFFESLEVPYNEWFFGLFAGEFRPDYQF